MKSLIGHIALGVALGAGLVSGTADADFSAFNPAAVCSWDGADDFRPTEEGALENYETTGIEHRLSCGIITTNDAGSSSTDNVAIYFYDGNDNGNMQDDVYCNVYSCDPSGATCNNEQTMFGDDSGGSTTQTAFGPDHGYIEFIDLDRPAFGVPNVTCAIPTVDSGRESHISGFLLIH